MPAAFPPFCWCMVQSPDGFSPGSCDTEGYLPHHSSQKMLAQYQVKSLDVYKVIGLNKH